MKKSLLEKNKYLKWVFLFLFVLTSAIHFSLSLQSAESSSDLSESITEDVVEVINDVSNANITVEDAHGFIRKFVGHFLWFVLIGFFGFLTFRFFFVKRYVLGISFGIIAGIIVCFISELLQKVSTGRSCEFKDVMLDFSGYIIFSIISICINLIKFIIDKKKNPNPLGNVAN